MSRSLAARTAIGASALALVGMLVMIGTAHLSITQLMQPPDHWSMPPEALAACEADPAAWSQHLLDVGAAWAYDGEGRSRNPAAPPLDPALVAQLQQARAASHVDDRGVRLAGQRVADSGDCALVTIQIAPPKTIVTTVLVGVLLGVTAGLLAVAAIVLGFVTRPLVQRIARLHEAARHVGAEAFPLSTDAEQDELGEIRAVLNAAHSRIRADADALRDREAALERHLAEIAHDLRTPLASLLLALQEVEAALPATLSRDPLVRALGDAESVAGLVDNLHQGSRLRHGLDLRAERTDLSEVVSRLEVRFAALGRLRGIEVGAARPDEPLWVACSPPLAERAIANLVHNAVSHGVSGGHVAILLDRLPDERFQLLIIDDGPGLPPEIRADLLTATTFLHDPARPRDGGLGIAITAEVARRVGWTLRYDDDTPGTGLRVTLQGPTTLSHPEVEPP